MSVAGWLGIDVGWVYPAVDSEGAIYTWAKKEHRREARENYDNHASPVTITKADGTTHTQPAYANEQIATMLACRTQRELSERCYHLANLVVAKAFQACQGLALERWSDDPQRNARWRVMHYVLMSKARDRQVPYVLVPRAYTSQTCPNCSHVSRENRPSRNYFECVVCGEAGHADVVAARNIAARAQAQSPADGSMKVPQRSEKRCSKCLEVKSRTEFYASTGSKDGKSTQCGACKRADHLHNKPWREGVCPGGRPTGTMDDRGFCPVCNHLLAIRPNGLVWRHKARKPAHYREAS